MRDGSELTGELRLPFPEPPPAGAAIELAPGLLWARMPLPFRLDHVNVWLLREDGGWTAIDCGVADDATRTAWEALLAGPLHGAPVHRLMATHGHVDHVGIAGWLAARSQASFHATRAAWLWARIGYLQLGKPTPPEALRHLAAHGADARHVAAFAADRGPALRLFGEQPAALDRLRGGDGIVVGGRTWQVHTADGHADEHASFFGAEDSILIAGDQILERISPVIGVFPGEPMADPLGAYVESLAYYEKLSPRTLVLPSHGLPFYGLAARIGQLRRHHDNRLALTLEALDGARSATECAHRLFARAMAEGQWFLALAETLAHLHRLVALGEAVRECDGGDVIRFSRR